MVLAAGGESSTVAQEALEHLCQTYWFPLYGHVRSKGFSPHDAEDLTQEFFARFLFSNPLRAISQDRGRFRAFLLASLNHFLANEWDRLRAQKRGGGKQVIHFDAVSAEERLALEPATDLTPERLYERRWTSALLDKVMGRLRSEMIAAGKGNLFETLRGFLSGSTDGQSYSLASNRLNSSEATTRKMVQRLRQRYRELLREEVAQTIASPHEVDDELKHLLAVFEP